MEAKEASTTTSTLPASMASAAHRGGGATVRCRLSRGAAKQPARPPPGRSQAGNSAVPTSWAARTCGCRQLEQRALKCGWLLHHRLAKLEGGGDQGAVPGAVALVAPALLGARVGAAGDARAVAGAVAGAVELADGEGIGGSLMRADLRQPVVGGRALGRCYLAALRETRSLPAGTPLLSPLPVGSPRQQTTPRCARCSARGA